MSKKNIFIIIGAFLTLILLFTAGKKKEINWFPSYSIHHKIPYGSYVFFDLAQKKLNVPIEKVSSTPFQFLKNNTSLNQTYLIYNDRVELGKTNVNALLDWIKKGNTLFLFTKQTDKIIEDTLGIRMKYHINLKVDSLLDINFTEKPYLLRSKPVFKRPYIAQTYIDTDSLSKNIKDFKVLGVLQDSMPSFVRLSYGKGQIYLHTIPEVVTNYFILQKKNYFYTQGILNYLNKAEKLYWDTHYQYGAGSNGIFNVLINTPAFLWAYRLLIAGVILFLLFEGKRKQRPVPIRTPPVNESLHFTKTIASMFLNRKEHKKIAGIRIRLFMDWLKNTLYLDLSKPENEWIKTIVQKTGLEEKEVEEVFKSINQLKNKSRVSAKEVTELEILINKIKNGI